MIRNRLVITFQGLLAALGVCVVFHVKAARVHVSDTAAVWVSLRQVERVVQTARTTSNTVASRDCNLKSSYSDV